MTMNKYYPGKPVNIYIQSLINIVQENNRVITTKKGKGKLPLFLGNGERVIPIYDPHELTWSLWTPPSEIVSVIASALRTKILPRDSMLVKLPTPMRSEKRGTISVDKRISTPYLSRTGIWCLSSTPSQVSTEHEPLPPAYIRYNTTWFRTPYGRLARRLPLWGPHNPASQVKASSTSGSNFNIGDISRKTRRKIVSSPPPYNFSATFIV